MRYLSLAVFFALALAGCNNDKRCDRASDCTAGKEVCAYAVHICVPITFADLTPVPDLTTPPDMAMGGTDDMPMSTDMPATTGDGPTGDMPKAGDMPASDAGNRG